MIRRKAKASKRVLMESLIALKKIKKEKQVVKEHYSKRFLNESKIANKKIVEKHLSKCYEEDCNELVSLYKDALKKCCAVPDLEGCFDGVCDADGCVFDDCTEEMFDDCLDQAIETLAWLVIPVRVSC